MRNWLQERGTLILTSLAERRYFLHDIVRSAVAAIAFVALVLFGRAMSLSTQIATGAAVLALILFWLMLEQALKYKKQLTPQLKAIYDDRAPDCHKYVKISSDGGTTNRDGRSIRVRIECGSDVAVEQCSGYLTRIEYRSHGGLFSEVPFYEPVRLNWALEFADPFQPVTVHPGIPKYLGVFSSDEQQRGFRLGAQGRSLVTPETFIDEGEYRLHLRIAAAQGTPLSCVLLVIWNGKWNEIRCAAGPGEAIP